MQHTGKKLRLVIWFKRHPKESLRVRDGSSCGLNITRVPILTDRVRNRKRLIPDAAIWDLRKRLERSIARGCKYRPPVLGSMYDVKLGHRVQEAGSPSSFEIFSDYITISRHRKTSLM
jgi:hypothetical protein